jgi:hypothetical protein
MNHITRIAAAALLAAGFAQGASAQWLTTTQDGDSIVVHGRDPNHNIVGGALVRVTGSGEGATTETISVQGEQAGRNMRVVGSGENQSVVEIQSAPPARFAAARGDRG